MKKFNNQKGITLISLVITIIVMLIIVGVTVTIALNGGLFTKANEASTKMQIEADKEELSMAIIATMNYGTGKVVIQDLASELGAGWTYSGSSFPYTFTKTITGNSFTVRANGQISLSDGEISTGAIPNLFLYEIIDEGKAEIVDINYDFLYSQAPGYDEYMEWYNNSESESGSGPEFDEEAMFEFYLANIVIPSTVKLNENGEYDEQGAVYTVTSIGDYLFAKEGTLTNIEIPEGVTYIGVEAFYQTSLTSVILPSTLLNISSSAFRQCDYLTNVYYRGTQAEWNEFISNVEDNEDLKNANIVYEYDGN